MHLFLFFGILKPRNWTEMDNSDNKIWCSWTQPHKLICKTEMISSSTLSNFCFILELINSVMLVSGVQQNDSVIHMYMYLFFKFFSHLSYYKSIMFFNLYLFLCKTWFYCVTQQEDYLILSHFYKRFPLNVALLQRIESNQMCYCYMYDAVWFCPPHSHSHPPGPWAVPCIGRCSWDLDF